jgi:hypothetical protein
LRELQLLSLHVAQQARPFAQEQLRSCRRFVQHQASRC